MCCFSLYFSTSRRILSFILFTYTIQYFVVALMDTVYFSKFRKHGITVHISDKISRFDVVKSNIYYIILSYFNTWFSRFLRKNRDCLIILYKIIKCCKLYCLFLVQMMSDYFCVPLSGLMLWELLSNIDMAKFFWIQFNTNREQ